MVRMFQPLNVPRGTSLSHLEFRTNDDGRVETVRVDDSVFLCNPDDYDLEVIQRSGKNVKEVSTRLFQRSVVYPKNQNPTIQQQHHHHRKETNLAKNGHTIADMVQHHNTDLTVLCIN